MNDSLNHGFSLPPEQQAIRDKCFHPSGKFVVFKEQEVGRSIPERFENIVQQFVRRFPDHTGNCAKKSAMTERAFKLLPEQEATSGTTT